MRLLLKLLRPTTVPSPNRKNIPFGTRVQLSLYRSCLKTLRHWYAKYAFSDKIVISGKPAIRLFHECRDTAFEAELKRLRMGLPDNMIVRHGVSSSQTEKRNNRPYYRCFHFEDTVLLDVDGQKISINHGKGRSFVSTLTGELKESDTNSIIAKYAFAGSRHQEKEYTTKKVGGISASIAGSGPVKGTTPKSPSSGPKPTTTPPPPPKKKAGPLFGDDPLFGKGIEKPEPPVTTTPPTIKTIDGVTIDESF